MIGDPRQGLRRSRAALGRFDRRRHRALTVTPEFYDLPFESVELATDDGLTLSGWFVPAAEQVASPLMVLMHHHYGGQKAALLPWLELFHQLGLASLAFDARDHADSPCPPGRGTYRQRFADVRAAFRELRRRGATKVLAYGQSQGGAVLIGGLADREELCGVILDSGPSFSALLSLWGLARDLPDVGDLWDTFGAATIVAELLRRMRPGTYPFHLWRGLFRMRRRPLLWLHGTEDRIIPSAWSGVWFDLLRHGAPRWQRMIVDGAQHAECLQQGGDEVARRVGRFVELVRTEGTAR